MRRFPLLFAALLAIAGLVACSDSAPKPDALLISIDSLRRDDLGVYGREPLFARGLAVSPTSPPQK